MAKTNAWGSSRVYCCGIAKWKDTSFIRALRGPLITREKELVENDSECSLFMEQEGFPYWLYIKSTKFEQSLRDEKGIKENVLVGWVVSMTYRKGENTP
jgi:hypothetical protein